MNARNATEIKIGQHVELSPTACRVNGVNLEIPIVTVVSLDSPTHLTVSSEGRKFKVHRLSVLA
jgi:hypothetical protein